MPPEDPEGVTAQVGAPENPVAHAGCARGHFQGHSGMAGGEVTEMPGDLLRIMADYGVGEGVVAEEHVETGQLLATIV